MKTRKSYTMLVTVTAPRGLPAAAIRREVRTLVTHQANWSSDPGDIKAVAVRGVASSEGGGSAADTGDRARLIAALQWLLDDMHDADETHGADGEIFDSVEDAAAALVEAGGALSWYSATDAKAYRTREKTSEIK